MQLTVVENAEIIAPGDGVQIYLRRSPLRQERDSLKAPAGSTIEEIVELCDVGDERLYVTINGHAIERSNWARVRVKPGATVNIVKVPGKGALRSILGAVVALAAAIFAPYLLGAIAPALVGTAAGTALTGVIGAGLPVTESLAIGRLFPLRRLAEQGECCQ